MAGAAFFAVLAIALLGGGGGLGGFFLDGLSWAAFILPGYFFAGALVLSLPGLRRDLLLALMLSIVPFFFLAISAKYLENPSLWNQKLPLFAAIGTFWVAAGCFLMAAITGLAVFLVSRKFVDAAFIPPLEEAKTQEAVKEEKQKPFGTSLDLGMPSLPPPPFLKSLGQTGAEEAAYSGPEAEEIQIPESHFEYEEAEELPPAEDEPVVLMFGRSKTAEAAAEPGIVPINKSDPATDPSFWDEAGASDETDELEQRSKTYPVKTKSALLSRVEVFNDGEHVASVREGKQPQKADKQPVRKVLPQDYSIPTEGILLSYPDGQYWVIDEKTRKAADVLRNTLSEFGIEAEVTGIRKGPVVTMFEILPAPGVRLSKIANLSDNIALRLAASSVRIVAPIPGKHAVGIEVPNEKRSIVSFREIAESESFSKSKMEVPVVLGKDISGEVQVAELTQTPHLLIAGATGSGKSVCVNAIILSILYKHSFNDVTLILIDPKIVELKLYNGIPHLLTPVITEPKKAFQALQYCICEMERRYSLLDAMGVRDIRAFNRKIKEKNMATDKLPYIVIVIDEFADLMATTGKELESTLARLAAMSRAVGLHLVLATQRPSIDVITGLIKANIPSRIAFMVASKFDSRIIIDGVGAEKLLGRGDMLYSSATDAFPVRIQGAFVSDDEVERLVAHVKTLGSPDYIDEEIFLDDEDDEGPSLFDEEDEDPLYEKALEIVLSQGKASASFLQRKLKIGYNRAARLVELMEEKGIVGKAQGSKPRDLMHNPDFGRMPNPKARYVPDFSGDDEAQPLVQEEV